MAERKEQLGSIVKRMASLSRLRFDSKQQDDFARKAEAVLAYVEQLSELDTSGIDPTSHAADFTTPLREDVARDSGMQDSILSNAPDRDGEYVVVPRVLEGEGA